MTPLEAARELRAREWDATGNPACAKNVREGLHDYAEGIRQLEQDITEYEKLRAENDERGGLQAVGEPEKRGKVLGSAAEREAVSLACKPPVSSGEGLSALDRLRLYAVDPETFPFDPDSAEEIIDAIDAARRQETAMSETADPVEQELFGYTSREAIEKLPSGEVTFASLAREAGGVFVVPLYTRPTPAQAVPSDMVLAPREPTKEMVEAGDIAKDDCIDSDWSSDAYGNRYDYTIINSDLPAIVWRAMLAAAPSADKEPAK